MEGRWEGSLDQQRVIKLSIGFGRFLIRGGRVPEEGQEGGDDMVTILLICKSQIRHSAAHTFTRRDFY